MKKYPAIIATALLAITLAGCGSTPPVPTAESPSPTPTQNVAEQPCRDFEALTGDMADLIVGIWSKTGAEDDAHRLDALPDQFDMLALKTDGAVGERIATVADLLQDTAPIVMSTRPDDYFDSIQAVQRACAAEDVEIGVATWK